MEIASLSDSDWDLFLRLAGEEGWRVPAREIALFRGPLARGAFVLREGGRPLGFATVVRHGRSGWIGNLLVRREERGRGFGARLFSHAVEALRGEGCRSLWLTASPQGRPLYEKHGFRAVDGVARWVRRVEADEVSGEGGETGLGALLAGDRLVWGEPRRELLSLVASGGRLFAFGGTAALLQEGAGMRVLGPWISRDLCPRENRRLILAVLAAAGEGEIVADVLASSPVHPLLRGAGFERRGECDLMVCGGAEGVNLAPLVSLASLGSMG